MMAKMTTMIVTLILFVLFFVCLCFVSDTVYDSVMWYYVFTDSYSD